MKNIPLISVLLFISLAALADGPIVQTTTFTRNVLRATNSTDAQIKLGFTGTNVTAVTLGVISNTAAATMVPFTNSMEFAVIANTNAPYGTYDIRQFGANLDGSIANNCSVTASSTTLTTSQAQWVPADVGKVISICFAGNAEANGTNQYFTTLISAYVSATQITLSNAVISTEAAQPAVYGHDDTPAWQAGINFVTTNGGTLFEPLVTSNQYSISIVNGVVKDVGDWRSHWNAQIFAPASPLAAMNPVPLVRIMGATPWTGSSEAQVTQQLPFVPYGSIIWSTLANAPQGTNQQWMFNFSAETGGSIGDGSQKFYGYNNIQPVFQNIRVVRDYNSGFGTINCGGVPSAQMLYSRFDGTFTDGSLSTIPNPNLTNDFGVQMPELGNYANNIIFNCEFCYIWTPILMGENTEGWNINMFAGHRACDFTSAGGNLMGFSGINQVQGVDEVFGNIHTATMLEATGFNAQQLYSHTNWILLNDPVNRVQGVIRCGMSASPVIGTNQAQVIGGQNCDWEIYATGGGGNIPLLRNSIWFNGSTVGGFPQAGSPKIINLYAPNFSSGSDSLHAIMGYAANALNASTLLIGQGTGIPYGAGAIDFATSASDTTAATQVGYVDGSGNWTIGQSGGNFTDDRAMTINTTLNLGNSETINSPSSVYFTVDGFSAGASYGQYFQRSAEWNAGIQDITGWPNMTANGSWFWNGPSGVLSSQVAIGTNDAIFASGGFADTATNTLALGSTGVTNTSAVNMVAEDISCTSGSITGFLTNTLTGYNYAITLNVPYTHSYVLQPGAALVFPTGILTGHVRAF